VLHERILAWMKACELRIALVKKKIFTYCDGTFVLLPKAIFVGLLLFSLFT
jgi:hypothetical protein